ncbi:hypothetical protein BV22DRAFT_128142 [Leucogyrophana mollusca]|uniref:Uncharacterized protein n=1 Tax=Leucogyrophana mollusca TaxID=85980 RepID=A0ACB8BX99_9AGAM|nr:hypothetical protein BV22DRAFT_128142 [Leucogyrophana mollusca]
MSDHYIPPPPTYELSQQGHDQKIPDQFQASLASLVISKTQISKVEEEEEEECDEGNEAPGSKDSQSKGALVQPLRINKRFPSGNGAQRLSRPLPPNPADAQTYSRQVSLSNRRTGHFPEDKRHDDYRYRPPPLASGPSYGHYASGSVPPSPLSSPTRASYDPPPSFYQPSRPPGPYQPTEQAPAFYPRTSLYGSQDSLSASTPSNRNTSTRVYFDPSVAYSSRLNQRWADVDEPRAVNPASLYSSAVSSHLHPSSAASTGTVPSSRQSYSGTKNRLSTQSRSSFAENVVLPDRPSSPTSSIQSYASYPSYPTQPLQTVTYPPRPRSSNGRWASTESDFTKDLYRS